jgi:hypothetical protein
LTYNQLTFNQQLFNWHTFDLQPIMKTHLMSQFLTTQLAINKTIFQFLFFIFQIRSEMGSGFGVGLLDFDCW